MLKIKCEFNNIIKAWIKGYSHNDIYHMILDWIEHNIQELSLNINTKNSINDIYNRMINNDSTQDIVEDFVYGEKYSNLRKEFK
jgi:hypothetical protein